MTITLLLIDVQNDFHPPNGSLMIPNADQDAMRIATFIETHAKKLNRIIATMDTHPKLHIAHPGFWIQNNTKEQQEDVIHPDPFTIISSNDIISGKWKPRPDISIPSEYLDLTIFEQNFNASKKEPIPSLSLLKNSDGTINIHEYCIQYTKLLEQSSKSKFQLCIWPEHCLLGSPGHCIVDIVQRAFYHWMEHSGQNVEYVLKGQNPLTEMYSVMAAEVPITKTTSFNEELYQSIMQSPHINDTSNTLIIAGQAMSHCVNYTVRDIIQKNLSTNNNHTKIYLLTDCCSAVPGFEQSSNEFLEYLHQNNVTLVRSTDIDDDLLSSMM